MPTTGAHKLHGPVRHQHVPCDLPCSNNVLTTITSLVDAIWSDMLTVVRLVAVCFGRLGLRLCLPDNGAPARGQKVSTNPKVRCEDGDPFELLMARIVDLIAETGENLLNNHLIDPANDFFKHPRSLGTKSLESQFTSML